MNRLLQFLVSLLPFKVTALETRLFSKVDNHSPEYSVPVDIVGRVDELIRRHHYLLLDVPQADRHVLLVGREHHRLVSGPIDAAAIQPIPQPVELSGEELSLL